MTTNSKAYQEEHIWLLEPPVNTNGVISTDGLSHIANHKYKAGSYTLLDNAMNQRWEDLTEWLPMWMAPNTVTSIGGSFCFASYLLSAFFNWDFVNSASIPDWVLVFNGMALLVYYTLDCMDGKQARRTNNSSPLGQLFDHGVDCISNLSHVSLMQAVLGLPLRSYLWLQLSMQLGFFQAQWEEYYTGCLPHAAGNFGTTEVLYGLGTWSILTGLGIFSRSMYALPLSQNAASVVVNLLPGTAFILGDDVSLSDLQVKHAFVVVWLLSFCVLSALSLYRVLTHRLPPQVFFSAISKLISPLLICFATQAFAEHGEGKSLAVRHLSLATGLLFCCITIKLVVLGMAKMQYATFQLDVLLLCGILGLIQIRPMWGDVVLRLASIGFFCRLFWWVHHACRQLCGRLGIKLFSIDTKTK